MASDHTPGSDQPQSSHVLYGTSSKVILQCPRVSPGSTSAHSLCRKQDLQSALGGSLPEVPRPGLAATEEWRPGRRWAASQRQREPSQRDTTEWTMVLRCDHIGSAPVVVDLCLRTEWEPCSSTRQSRRLLDSSPDAQQRQMLPSEVNEVLEFLTVIASAKNQEVAWLRGS